MTKRLISLLAALTLAAALAIPCFAWAEPADDAQSADAASEGAAAAVVEGIGEAVGDALEGATGEDPATAEDDATAEGEEPTVGEEGEGEKPVQIDEKNLVNPQQRPDSSFIYDALISDLTGADSYMNEQTVQVTGEVVGDRIYDDFDRDTCWIVLQATDGSYAEISVHMPTSSAAAIDTFGAYGKTGTILQVRGTFNIACQEHEGMIDVHADNVVVVATGSAHPDELNPRAFIPGAVSLVIGLVLTVVFFRLRESRR